MYRNSPTTRVTVRLPNDLLTAMGKLPPTYELARTLGIPANHGFFGGRSGYIRLLLEAGLRAAKKASPPKRRKAG